MTLARQATRPIIEIAGVSKTYRTRDGEVPSLRPIDFAIHDAEFFVVVGPSGCGKTTLLKMIAGLLPPSEGQIQVDGRRVTRPHGGVGIVFQTAMLLPWRNIFQNVMMPVEVKKLPRSIYEPRAAALLKMVGLASFERKYLEELLQKHKGNVTKAAAEAEEGRRSFTRLMRKHNFVRRSFLAD